MRRYSLPALFLWMLVSLPAVLAAAEPAAPGGSHEQAARELFDVIGGKGLANTASLAMLQQLKSNPELAPYEDILQSWVQKVWVESDIDKMFVRLYTETFSEDELRQMTAFYQTPVGQKALQKMPELMQKGMAYGQQEAQAHLPELQQAMAARKAELEKAGGSKKPQ